MAKLERTLHGQFDQLLQQIENGILESSLSASLEDASDFYSGKARCSVRVFERFSSMGGNRLSLSVTLFQGEDGEIRLSAISAGGSQGMFMKINRMGENAFLGVLKDVLGQM